MAATRARSFKRRGKSGPSGSLSRATWWSPTRGTSAVVGVGTVREPGYQWRPERPEYRHTVAVDWKDTTERRVEPVRRWGLTTVSPVSQALYQRILAARHLVTQSIRPRSHHWARRHPSQSCLTSRPQSNASGRSSCMAHLEPARRTRRGGSRHGGSCSATAPTTPAWSLATWIGCGRPRPCSPNQARPASGSLPGAPFTIRMPTRISWRATSHARLAPAAWSLSCVMASSNASAWLPRVTRTGPSCC
jgi:hypothetical protein